MHNEDEYWKEKRQDWMTDYLFNNGLWGLSRGYSYQSYNGLSSIIKAKTVNKKKYMIERWTQDGKWARLVTRYDSKDAAVSVIAYPPGNPLSAVAGPDSAWYFTVSNQLYRVVEIRLECSLALKGSNGGQWLEAHAGSDVQELKDYCAARNWKVAWASEDDGTFYGVDCYGAMFRIQKNV